MKIKWIPCYSSCKWYSVFKITTLNAQNVSKKYKIPEEDLVELVPHDGGCIATDRITVDGCEVGYMYREDTDREADTGWRFFAGDESQEYIDDLSHSDVYAVNTIANYDPAILDYLATPAPCAFEKIPGKREFRPIEPDADA